MPMHGRDYATATLPTQPAANQLVRRETSCRPASRGVTDARRIVVRRRQRRLRRRQRQRPTRCWHSARRAQPAQLRQSRHSSARVSVMRAAAVRW